MTSEHTHRWDTARSRCLECGHDAEDIADELQQQLAQAREALMTQELNLNASIRLREEEKERWKRMFYENDAKALKYDQARALLDDAITHMMLTRTTEAQIYLDIRTFLAEHPKQ